MFEQEAEEYTMKKICKNCTYRCYTENILKSNKLDCFSYARGYKIFKDGAEFGYNRVNEWHFVKDELPPVKKEYNGRSELVLVLSKEKEMQYAQYVEKEKTWARGICEINFKPYAWKEIVLPELPEENE